MIFPHLFENTTSLQAPMRTVGPRTPHNNSPKIFIVTELVEVRESLQMLNQYVVHC
jgi:hypothetical protein